MMRHSVLDLCPVPEGSTVADALANTLDLAQHTEKWGYKRFWLAEHHNMTGIASAATAVAIGYVAGGTKTIRVGAGGIMLPNHAPLVVAEQFGTLATLYPKRIDLGLGRAPGTDSPTVRALRRSLTNSDNFPADVQELMGYLGEEQPGAAVRAVPGSGTHVPIWILGSSTYGAQLAAKFGLPYAFASHFAPDALSQALHLYRSRFQPSEHLRQPYCMLAVNVFAGADDDEGRFLKTSMEQAFARLFSGRPGPLPKPVQNTRGQFDLQLMAMVDRALAISATGSPQSVQSALADLVEQYQPDELIVTGQIHSHKARLRSYEIAAEVLSSLTVRT